MMKERGYSDDEIDAILVRNPRRLLTFVVVLPVAVCAHS